MIPVNVTRSNGSHDPPAGPTLKFALNHDDLQKISSSHGCFPGIQRTPMRFTSLLPGDPAPWFRQKSASNPNYEFDSAAGRHLVLCFLGSGGDAHAMAAIQAVLTRPTIFNDSHACFFGVSNDPADQAQGRLEEHYPGYRYFFDFDARVARQYGVAALEPEVKTFRRIWFIIDPTLRISHVVPFAKDQSDIAKVLAILDALPPPARFSGFDLQAPILFLPNVFEPKLCEELIGLYQSNGGKESGFMQEIDGKSVIVTDHGHKRRRDFNIEEESPLTKVLQARVLRRIVPEIRKVHHFNVTRMERYVVSCYAEEDQAHFNAHRDNTTKATEHRRFAVSINLNDDFDGGEIMFPEYGLRAYKPPPGGAVVFSCSLLHAVSKVTRGRRYAFLPFLYDDAAAKLREDNNSYLGEGVQPYAA
jgi:predicted 2-oxoglutarate/Fe(II)-dependent dioxygenase YbiX/peroxiredoxin